MDIIDLISDFIFYGFLFTFFAIFSLFMVDKYNLYTLSNSKKGDYQSIAFFHPYCNGCGGGEKVLWCMVYSIVSKINQYDYKEKIVIFSAEKEEANTILDKAQNRFNIPLVEYQDKIQFIYVEGRNLLQPKGFLTMALQILGTYLFTLRAIKKFKPDVFIDSIGFSFSTYANFIKYFIDIYKYLRHCHVFSYVHYPFISEDMIERIRNRTNMYNNNQTISKSKALSLLKLQYYQLLVQIYKTKGQSCDIVFVNSSWTENHMKSLWKTQNPNLIIEKMYPPCNVTHLLQYEAQQKEKIIMSFAQFRPEKDHIKQINIFEKFDQTNKDYKFYIVGSCRDKGDEEFLESLKVKNSIQFVKNPPYSELLQIFKKAQIGIHTMIAEHFGIACVEMMAAGLILLAHDSAGPKMDIIKTKEYGILCDDEDSYVVGLKQALNIISDRNKYEKMIIEQRKRAQQFGDELFIQKSSEYFTNFLQI